MQKEHQSYPYLTIIKGMRRVLFCIIGILLPVNSVTILAQGYQPLWLPTGDSEFEVGTQLRPWTIADEGMETIFENFSMAGVNSVYFLAVMHQESRPFQSNKFPHNPVRSVFQAEDSRIAFHPDWKRYGEIKPVESDHEWIRKTDWLKFTIDACRKRGMSVGAEVSHYPVPKEMLKAHPEWLQKDINGEVKIMNQFCPNNPAVREYLIALFSDLAGNYDLDYIQTCQYVFSPNDIDNGGGCFCAHCIQEAEQHGVDMNTIRVALKKDKHSQPERSLWEDNRIRVATKLFQDLATAIHIENPDCHLRLNDVYSHRKKDPGKRGIDVEAIGPYLGSLVNQDHTEQYGKPVQYFEYRKEWLETNRKALGYDKPLICGIATRLKATPGLIREGIEIAVQHPAKINGIALKHYDGASYSLLRAVRQGMIEAGVQGLQPVMGLEAEEMNLDGYKVFQEELADDWGIETLYRGEASAVFDHPSGVYTIRISYYDEDVGKSKIKLFVEGKKVLSFTMDEDTDCWRWRKFEGIEIKEGDEILLYGKTHKGEKAIVDFIEFTPEII